MANPSQIISQINLLTTSSQGVPESQFKTAAESFSQLCREINERLARVQTYLTSGLRSEALYTAEVEPSIITLCKAVEQARVEDWDRVCKEHHLERPPRVNIEGLRLLKDAAAMEHSLRPLLKKHRRLALSQASIKERLEVLRELSKADPGTLHWEQDIKTFESARASELTPLLKQPGSISELSRAQDILRELTDGTWRTKISPELLDNARRAVQRLQSVEARKEIKLVLPKLHESHQAKDFEAVKGFINQINEITESRGVPMPSEIQTELLNVYEFVAREEIKLAKRKEMEEACTALRAALDRKADVIEVSRLWTAARAFDMALPEELEREAQLRIRMHEQAKRRRTQLVVSIIVLTVGGVIAGIVYQYRERSTRDLLAATKQQIETAVSGGKFDTATSVLDGLAKSHPGLINRPEIESLRKLVTDKIAAEEKRKEKFKNLYAETIAKGVDEPDETSLENLKAIARTDEEKDKLTAFLRDVDTAREVRQESIDMVFRQQAAALVKLVNPVSEMLADTNPAGLSADLEKFEKQLADLEGNNRVSKDSKLSLEPARAKIRKLRAALKAVASRKENDSAFNAALNSLADSVWSPTQHKQRLDIIHEQFPNYSRAESLKNAALQVNAWVAVQKWNQITEDWQRKLAPDRKNIDERLKIVEDYLQRNPNTPLVNAVKEYESYLKAAAKALGDKGPWRGDYKKMLAAPLMRDLWRVKLNTGKTYYLIPGDGNPRSNSVGTSISAVVTADINKTASLEFKPGVAGKSEMAPHAKFAQAWLEKIEQFPDNNWDTFGLEALHAITVQPDIDPIVRLVLVHRTLRTLRDCVWGLDDIDSVARKVESKVVSDDAAWLNPDDAEAPNHRNAARDLLANLPSFDNMIQTVKSNRRALFKPLQFEVVTNAVALQDGTNWRILTQSKDARELKNGQRLLITADKGKTLREIGSVQGGKPVVDLTRMIGVDEGTLIFICDIKND